MGLDMYLTAKKYVGFWSFSEEEERTRYKKITNDLGIDHTKLPLGNNTEGSLTVSVKVAYWRKANAIHSWFVNNVQNGNDDCHEYYVNRHQLETLNTICRELLEYREKLSKEEVEEQVLHRLPPTSGFFFGSTDIADRYWEDIKYTHNMINSLLINKELESFNFYYQSSW